MNETSGRCKTCVQRKQTLTVFPGRNAGLALTFAAAFLIMLVPDASAQPVTPAQSAADEYLRRLARERQLRLLQERTTDVRLPGSGGSPALERLPGDEAACVKVEAIDLVGDSARQFSWAIERAHQTSDGLLDTATGRCLGTAGINLVMRRIQNAIVARGFVTARVMAGPQARLNDGTLELTLFPGRIRQIRFATDTDARATQWNGMPVQPGDLLNLRDIEQALENFKRIPTVQADIQIAAADGPDAQPGQSDLIIKWKQSLPFRLSLSADDSGSRASGRHQGNLTLTYDNWWTLNDLFYISLNHNLTGSASEHGTRGTTVHYSLPLGYSLLGITASTHRYHQSVAGASQVYRYSGQSENGEIKLSHLVYRDASRKTTLSARAWVRASRNFIDGTEVAVQRRRMAGLDVSVSHREFIGTATLDANLNYRRGTGAFGSLAAPEEPFGEGTSRPRIITADAQVNAPFSLAGERLRYTASWRAQWNKTPLVPQDRFYIGGRYTVRGFDGESQLLAERGWLVRNELGWTVGQTGQEIYLGVDYGEVGGPSSATLVGTHLSGAVLGLRGGAQGFSYDVFLGAPLSKPSGFKTATAAGFNLNWSF